ncbi:MAG: molybdopterin dinucleotide binding domain-containing protein [Adlercreutzia equolifaciens]
MISCHGRQSAHSSFANVPELAVVAPRRLSVNPVDAERLQLVSGGLVVVENDRGALVCRVRVTPRIMPGVVALPEAPGTMRTWRVTASTGAAAPTRSPPTSRRRGRTATPTTRAWSVCAP